MFYTPADIVNRSLDALGVGYALGSLNDGTDESEPARRAYGPALRQLLRGAHWNFARKDAALTILGDATGAQLPPNGPATTTFVERPWRYAYAWPIDGVGARWLPWNYDTTPQQPPLMVGLNNLPNSYPRQHPARFLVSSSEQYPVLDGAVPWEDLPDFSSSEGVGPVGRRIVLTDVPCAHLVYTRLVLSIEEWDELFTEAFVALMAQRLALIAVKDRKEAIALRNTQIAIVKDSLSAARAANANDAGFPQTPDHVPDWIRARRSGGWGGYGGFGVGEGPGVLNYGWSPVAFADGSVF